MTPGTTGAVADGLSQSLRPVRGLQDVPGTPGLYAWWAPPRTIPGLSGSPHPSDEVELLYVGIASDLRQRVVARHLKGGAGASTLRRTLAAVLTQEGLTTRWTSTRVTLTPDSETALTAWMEQYLSLSWVEYPDPESVEPEVIALMRPPLNGDLNRHHPSYPAVRTALAAWRATAGPKPTT